MDTESHKVKMNTLDLEKDFKDKDHIFRFDMVCARFRRFELSISEALLKKGVLIFILSIFFFYPLVTTRDRVVE